MGPKRKKSHSHGPLSTQSSLEVPYMFGVRLFNYLVLRSCWTNNLTWNRIHTWTANFTRVFRVVIFRLLFYRIGEFSRTDTFTCGGSFRRSI